MVVSVMPPPDATDEFLHQMGSHLGITFDIDLGELVPGHRVVARGLEMEHPTSVEKWRAVQLTETLERAKELAREEMARRADEADTLGFSFSELRRRTPAERVSFGSAFGSPPVGAQLHYDLVPGLDEQELRLEGRWFFEWVTLRVSDDIGTPYRRGAHKRVLQRNFGTLGPRTGGEATHATADLGGDVPGEAKRLLIGVAGIRVAPQQRPPNGRIVIDLVERRAENAGM